MAGSTVLNLYLMEFHQNRRPAAGELKLKTFFPYNRGKKTLNFHQDFSFFPVNPISSLQ